MERGNDAELAVGESTPPRARYGTQDFLSNDEVCRLSVRERRPDEKCHVEVPGLSFPPVERGWRAEDAEMTRGGLGLVDVKGLDAGTEKLELIEIEETGPSRVR